MGTSAELLATFSETGRVPYVRLTCPGVPWGVTWADEEIFQMLSLSASETLVVRKKKDAWGWGYRPVLFVPRTPHGTPGR